MWQFGISLTAVLGGGALGNLPFHRWGSVSHWSECLGRSRGPKWEQAWHCYCCSGSPMCRWQGGHWSSPASSPPEADLLWCWAGNSGTRGHPAACSCQTALMRKEGQISEFNFEFNACPEGTPGLSTIFKLCLSQQQHRGANQRNDFTLCYTFLSPIFLSPFSLRSRVMNFLGGITPTFLFWLAILWKRSAKQVSRFSFRLGWLRYAKIFSRNGRQKYSACSTELQ